MEMNLENFIMANSPDGGFLQSEYWRKFQESAGRKTFVVSDKENGELVAYASIITHSLPVAGDYFYVPRGPVVRNPKSEILNPKQYQIPNTKYQNFLDELTGLAVKNKIGWIRIEPNSDNNLEIIRNAVEIYRDKLKIVKSAVDMQPREILVMDMSKSEGEILAGMKQKTRYNIRLSKKKGVRITHNVKRATQKNIEDFLRLVKITAERDKIVSHPASYYRKMFEVIPPEILKLYVAEYHEKIIVANLVVFLGKTATYLHGASDNIHREVMAPYLLQWVAMLDAKKAGCTRYDLGGVKIPDTNSWVGITRFKTGFAPGVKPVEFPGCYDIILNPARYGMYRILQKVKRIF